MERPRLVDDVESFSREQEKCNASIVEKVTEEDVHHSRIYTQWRTYATNTLILAAIVIVGLFFFQIRLQPTPLPPKNVDSQIQLPSNIPRSLPQLVKDEIAPNPANMTPMVNLAVYQPVLLPGGLVDQTIDNEGNGSTKIIAPVPSKGICATVLLMRRDFASSYGQPFIGNYTPPNCNFNRVVINFTVASIGRQFDRMAMFFLNDTEVWRTSTAEPTRRGIVWTYMKDMTEYLSLWKTPQTVFFDLPNNVFGNFTGIYNTTLTATFFESDAISAAPADLIVPISTTANDFNNGGKYFSLPSDTALKTVGFPQNANRAVFSVSATGQADEEFWWGNVLSSASETFNASISNIELPGGSAWREVQVLIDGQLAGVQWPFPIIFTGGILPTFWKPIAGLDAFDLREHEIDITPWLPQLCDGKQHTFQIKVVSLGDDGKGNAFINETGTANAWYVTGKVFVWLDATGSITTGTTPIINTPAPQIVATDSITQNSTGFNETLTTDVNVQRTISITSTVTSKNGSTNCTWTQNLSFTNNGRITDQGNAQLNRQETRGTDVSIGPTNYKSIYYYPLWVNSTFYVNPFNISENYTDNAINYGYTLQIEGTSVYPTGLEPFSILPSTSKTISSSPGSILSANSKSFGRLIDPDNRQSAETAQDFSFGALSQDGGAKGVKDSFELYHRYVSAVNGSIARDIETLAGVGIADYTNATALADGIWDGGTTASALKTDVKLLSEGTVREVVLGGASDESELMGTVFNGMVKKVVGPPRG